MKDCNTIEHEARWDQVRVFVSNRIEVFGIQSNLRVPNITRRDLTHAHSPARSSLHGWYLENYLQETT